MRGVQIFLLSRNIIIYCKGKIMAAIHEGPEYGVGDFVLLESVDISSFMENLKLR